MAAPTPTVLPPGLSVADAAAAAGVTSKEMSLALAALPKKGENRTPEEKAAIAATATYRKGEDQMLGTPDDYAGAGPAKPGGSSGGGDSGGGGGGKKVPPAVKNKDGVWTKAEQNKTGFSTYKSYLNWWNTFTAKTDGVTPGQWKKAYGLTNKEAGGGAWDPYRVLINANDRGKLELLNYTYGTKFNSLDEAINNFALGYGFAGLTQYRMNQQGKQQEVANNPNLHDVTFSDIRYDDDALGLFLGRAAELAYRQTSRGQNSDVVDDWNQLVPDWAQGVDEKLQSAGHRFGFELLSSPEINMYDPTKPLFGPGERPTSLSQLTGQGAGESSFYRGLSAAELLEQIYPIYDDYYNRPAGSPPPAGVGGLTLGSEGNNPIKDTAAYKRYTALNQPGAGQGSGLISDPKTGIQWNPYTGEVQFLPGQRDQQSIDMQEQLVKALSGQQYDPNRIGVLGQAILSGDPNKFMSAVGSGAEGLLTDNDAMMRLAAVINSPVVGGGVNSPGQNLTGKPPFDAQGNYKFNIVGAPVVQTLDPKLAHPDTNKGTQPKTPAGTTVNPQLLPPQLPALANPAGAQTDSEYEAQRAGLTSDYQQAYAKVLQALGFTDPSTGQKMPGDVQIDAERIRQEALRNMGLAGEAVQGQFQRGGALFSGRYAEERARAEYPYVSGLADLDVSTSRTLAELYQQAAGLISEYENSNNLLLADLAKRKSQSTMIPVPGA